jgi:uncharacterized protein (TIGR02391 family)
MERQFSQSELEAIAAALGDTSEGLTGSEIGHLLATVKMADPTPLLTKWKRLFNAFVERQNFSQNRRAIMEFIQQAMKPERYTKYPERFEPMRANLNRALAFCALAVNAAGQIIAVGRAETLSDAQRRANELRADLATRGVHPDVLRFCRAELVGDNYFHAVLEATKSIADKLREKSGLSEDGARLVDATLCGTSPRLAINGLTTESQRSEQSGFANLVKGVFGMFRNPTAHEARVLWAMSKEDAEDILSIASLIHRRLDAAQ